MNQVNHQVIYQKLYFLDIRKDCASRLHFETQIQIELLLPFTGSKKAPDPHINR